MTEPQDETKAAVGQSRLTVGLERLPCPFCGKTETLEMITGRELMDDDQEFWPHSESWAVVCSAEHPKGKGGCGAMGGFAMTEEAALQKWNMRSNVVIQGPPVGGPAGMESSTT